MFTFFIWGVRHDVPLDLTETLEMFFWQTFPQRHTRKILKNRDTTVLVCDVKYGRIVVWTHLCFFSTIFVQESVYGLCFWQHSCESSNKFNVNEILIHIHSDFDVFLLFDCVYLCDWIDGWLLFLIVLHIHDSQWMPSVFVLCLFVFVCVLCAYSGGGGLKWTSIVEYSNTKHKRRGRLSCLSDLTLSCPRGKFYCSEVALSKLKQCNRVSRKYQVCLGCFADNSQEETEIGT